MHFYLNQKLTQNEKVTVTGEGLYYVEIPDLLPQELDQQIVLAVTDTAGNSLQITYSPLNYMVRMCSQEDKNLQNLMQALYNYHLTAKAL